MNQTLLRQVRRLAGHRCDYCRIPAAFDPLPFQVDHIIARQHGGQSVLQNLAWSCLHDNKLKGPNVAGIDPVTDHLVALFHLRGQRSERRFVWNGGDPRGPNPDRPRDHWRAPHQRCGRGRLPGRADAGRGFLLILGLSAFQRRHRTHRCKPPFLHRCLRRVVRWPGEPLLPPVGRVQHVVDVAARRDLGLIPLASKRFLTPLTRRVTRRSSIRHTGIIGGRWA